MENSGLSCVILTSKISTSVHICFHPFSPLFLLLQDVVFVEHRRPWPGSDLTEHSQLSMASSTGSMTGDLDSANIGSRWLSTDFPPACPHCGTTTNTYSLYCVFDGHNGVHAAKMAGDSVLPLVESKLPLGCPPPVDHPSYTQFREGIQLALVESIVEMNHLFAQRGIHAGATATVVLQHGWLVTAAGLGDSRAVVDTGYETMSLSADHRVASHKGERRRVEAMGGIVAPLAMWGTGPADDYTSGVGPLRIWPGGLAISRAIGDFDVGEAVLPFPHVTQVLLPPTGGRLLVASDGIWDAFDKMSRAGGMSRSWSTEAAPTRMIQTIVRAFGGLKDDTTLVVADILPEGTTFPQVASAAKKGGMASNGSPSSSQLGANGGGGSGGGGGGLCGCFGGGASATIDDSPSTRANPSVNGGMSAASPQDLSVRSMSSNASASIRGGKPRLEILASVDVAGIMGLMPEPELVIPGWYTPEVGERLFRSASDASDTWNAAHNKRYARPPATPVMPEVERIRRKGRKGIKSVAFNESTMEKQKSSGSGSGMPRSASMHFSSATVDSGENFASKFGHYTNADGTGTLEHTPSGGFLAEASVRAGRVYNSEASVRAGSVNKPSAEEDPSVRLRGSNLEGSVHMKTSKLMSEESLQGLAPVRVAKRSGSTPAVTVPVAQAGLGKNGDSLSDSVKEHMLRLAPEELATIGE
jgi:serine/threonine protein phosphatase PrpC